MPRYSKETTAALKRVLMCRRDNRYRFAEEDLPELMQTTGLSRAEIVQWAVDVRAYYDSPEAMEKFFERNGAVSDIKCLWTPVYICCYLFGVFFVVTGKHIPFLTGKTHFYKKTYFFILFHRIQGMQPPCSAAVHQHAHLLPREAELG